MSITAILLIICIGHLWSFLAASFLLGMSRGTRMIVYPPAVKQLSGLADATGYFAVAPILILPVAGIVPLVCGKFLDHFQNAAGDAYRVIFAAAVVFIGLTLVCILKTDFSDSAS
jgi:hypothetical protein